MAPITKREAVIANAVVDALDRVSLCGENARMSYRWIIAHPGIWDVAAHWAFLGFSPEEIRAEGTYMAVFTILQERERLDRECLEFNGLPQLHGMRGAEDGAGPSIPGEVGPAPQSPSAQIRNAYDALAFLKSYTSARHVFQMIRDLVGGE